MTIIHCVFQCSQLLKATCALSHRRRSRGKDRRQKTIRTVPKFSCSRAAQKPRHRKSAQNSRAVQLISRLPSFILGQRFRRGWHSVWTCQAASAMDSYGYESEHRKKRRRREVAPKPIAARLTFDDTIKSDAAFIPHALRRSLATDASLSGKV